MNVNFSPNTFPPSHTFLWIIFYPLVAISFIFIANDNPFWELIHLSSFISDVFFALIVTFLVGFYLQWLTYYLDKTLTWNDNFADRLKKQFLLGVLLPLFAAMSLEIFYLYLIKIPLASSSMLNLELPLAFLFLLIANLFYLVNFLYLEKKTVNVSENIALSKSSEKVAEIEIAPNFIPIQKGFTEEKIEIEHCAFIVSANKMLWLHTFSGDQYRLKGTLEEWEEKLKNAGFYRLNRQYLATAAAIRSVEQTETRKLKINFILATEEEVYVSKPNVAHFRQWWQQ